ncbi:MAG: hypothetical protein LBF97_03610, partial [Elusimicrobiota bacterium]|nr:hypothetical protein [Elusimicrobiota bacterium]
MKKNFSYINKNIKRKFYSIFILLLVFLTIFLYINLKTINIDIFYTSDIYGNILTTTSNHKVFGLISLPYILDKYD